jgi:hypothetical protein
MMTLTATVIKGLGAATANLKKQLPPIAEEFPEVRDCFHGTLNVELERGLLVLSADHRTKPVNWDPAHAPGEVFDFLRIRFEAPEGSEAIPAWLYIPHNSDHRMDLSDEKLTAFLELEVSCRGRWANSRKSVSVSGLLLWTRPNSVVPSD